jgi:hypothetical protein
VTTAEPPLATEPLKQTSYKTRATTLKPQYQNQVGSSEDYKWITGQLSYVRSSRGGTWVLCYAAPDQVDRYGGCVILMATPELKEYHDGELVCVEGEVIKGKDPPKDLAGALYRVTAIAHVSPQSLQGK